MMTQPMAARIRFSLSFGKRMEFRQSNRWSQQSECNLLLWMLFRWKVQAMESVVSGMDERAVVSRFSDQAALWDRVRVWVRGGNEGVVDEAVVSVSHCLAAERWCVGSGLVAGAASFSLSLSQVLAAMLSLTMVQW